MIDKERIIKLLESKHLDDILIGVQLSYKLPFKEFKALYDRRRVNLQNSPALYYRFWREGIKFGFGNAGFLTINWDEYYNEPHIIDITPENIDYEG